MTKSEFLSAVERKPVPFAGAGISCHLRHITAGEWSAWEIVKAMDGDDVFTAWLFVRSVCDAEGKRLFGDEDMHHVKGMPLDVVNAVCGRIQQINGMTEADQGKASSTSGPVSSSSSS